MELEKVVVRDGGAAVQLEGLGWNVDRNGHDAAGEQQSNDRSSAGFSMNWVQSGQVNP